MIKAILLSTRVFASWRYWVAMAACFATIGVIELAGRELSFMESVVMGAVYGVVGTRWYMKSRGV